MITRDYFRLSHPDAPMAASYGSHASCEEWRDRDPMCTRGNRDAAAYVIEPIPHCACCGDDFSNVRDRGGSITHWESGARCDRHHDRNPCAIEGCRCTTAAGGRYASDQYLCQKHWRPLTLPAERRVYSRIWREGKKYGWTMARSRRLERVWRWIVAKARSRAAGDIDMDEINRMFGWDDAA